MPSTRSRMHVTMYASNRIYRFRVTFVCVGVLHTSNRLSFVSCECYIIFFFLWCDISIPPVPINKIFEDFSVAIFAFLRRHLIRIIIIIRNLEPGFCLRCEFFFLLFIRCRFRQIFLKELYGINEWPLVFFVEQECIHMFIRFPKSNKCTHFVLQITLSLHLIGQCFMQKET